MTIQSPDSVPVLSLLGEHHDFMESLSSVALMEDATGEDAAWFADYQSDVNDKSTKLNIKLSVYGKQNRIRNANKRPKMTFVNCDIAATGTAAESYDLIWAKNCLNTTVNPIETLRHWWSLLKEDGMLCLSVPQTAFIDDLSRWQIYGYSGQYYSWNLVNLIQMLAVNGFDCRDAHFKQTRHDPHIWAAVYKSSHKPLDPTTTNWYQLQEAGLTPASLDKCIQSFGYVKHEFLKVEWLDHTVYDLAIESVP
jgi:SAM-dependent methyltransferase